MERNLIPINKLMHWRGGAWMKYGEGSDIFLQLHCDQLLITNGDKVLESINMIGKIKGIYKNDVLILIVFTGAQEIRKFKFQIKNNVVQHLQKLGEHFLVVSHKNSSSDNSTLQYRKLDDVFKNILEDYSGNAEASNLPTNFGNFIKLCLLDPTFPQVVHETQKLIETQIMKNK